MTNHDPATPDFAACAAGLSKALKKIQGGFTTLGDEHFQQVAEDALERWGYFPPNPPPDWLAREWEVRQGFLDALAKTMALMDYRKEIENYRARAVEAESRVQDLLRVVATYEAASALEKEKTPA